MERIVKKKIILWVLLSIDLLAAFFVGLITFTFSILFGIIFGLTIIPTLICLIYLILSFFTRSKEIKSKKLSIGILLTLNLLFSYLIGATIPFMESKMLIRYNMALVMLPLLIILNYILLDRCHYHLKQIDVREEDLDTLAAETRKDVPVIEFEGKKYIFTIRSIVLLGIGAPILAYAVYLFFDNQMNYWLHEIVVKQTVFFLNLLFNMNASAEYSPVGKYHWNYVIPNRGEVYFETFCTGLQAVAVFAGIIICTPHSKDKKTNEDIVWRKTKALVISSAIFYVINIIRMVIQLYLFHLGYAWEDIHYSISAASSFIAAIIVLLMHKWIPEFIISIIYAGTLVSKKLKEKNIIKEKSNNSSEEK